MPYYERVFWFCSACLLMWGLARMFWHWVDALDFEDD